MVEELAQVGKSGREPGIGLLDVRGGIFPVLIERFLDDRLREIHQIGISGREWWQCTEQASETTLMKLRPWWEREATWHDAVVDCHGITFRCDHHLLRATTLELTSGKGCYAVRCK